MISTPSASPASDTSGPGPALPRVVADATCTACGCLCDDLELTVADGRVVAAEHACALGLRWFTSDHDQRGLPHTTIEGRPAADGEALDRAAAILRNAKAPVVLGLTRTTNEAVAAALAIADRVGATVDVGDAQATVPVVRAVQRVGIVTATLGEVKNRADLVIFWGADPLVTHPRHWERYSVEPRGRFVPAGRTGRTVIVVDAVATATSERADQFVAVAAEAQFETLTTIRALVNGVALDPSRVQQATGLSLETIRDFAQRLLSARYGAWFYGAEFARGRGGSARLEAALRLVRDLNARTRFVILPLGGAGNSAGAESVLTWQSGSPQSVDFAGDFPCALAEESSAALRLARGEADAALIVGGGVDEWLPAAARVQLARIDRVVIAPRATITDRTAAVAFCSATCGIDAAGTVTRVDGVLLPLRPPLAALVPSDLQWLAALRARLQ